MTIILNLFQFILKDALNRISKSELYDSTMHFNIFICNGLWRFMIFTHGNKDAGAVTYQHLTGNIFFRPSDIAKNKIIPPANWKFAKNLSSFLDRPFSYFFAYEITHELEANFTGRLNFNEPTWLTEGYADYIS